MDEGGLRQAICDWGQALFARGLVFGSSGNISVRLPDGFLITPTNSCLGRLSPDSLSKLDAAGDWCAGDKPSKEFALHNAFYAANPKYGAVVHLHSTYATLLSCMEHSSDKNVLRPLTPYPIMRLGNVPIVAYSKPGSELVAERIAAVAAEANANAVLIANHGPIVAGSDLQNAVFAAEEMEEAAKLQILGDGLKLRLLNKDELAELVATMRLK